MRELIIEKFEEPTETTNYGAMIWKDSCGHWHRENDLPAVISKYGCKEWFKHGLCHRNNDKPAEINSKEMIWRINHKIHRNNGKPAIVRPDGSKEWWINGVRIKKNY